MKRIAFILNPISGTRKKQVIVDYINKVLGFHPEWDAEFYRTKCVGDAYSAARDFASQGVDVVVAIGGDGTVNEVAEGLIGSSSRLAIIPMGSGNGLARHLSISLNYHRAVDTIFNGQSQLIDAGVINGKVFFCTAGVGFDAVVGDKFNKSGSRGLVTYVEFCAREYLKYRPEYYEISLDGRKFREKAFLITFANSSQWGNNAFIAPDANISDGMVDVVVWREAPRVTMPFLTAELFLKTLKYSGFVKIYRCREVIINRGNDGLVQFDGESVMMGKELEMSVLDKAVEIIVPAGWKPIPQIRDLMPPALRDIMPHQWKDILPKLKDIVK